MFLIINISVIKIKGLTQPISGVHLLWAIIKIARKVTNIFFVVLHANQVDRVFMKPSLIVLAAGMGKRYVGDKQLDKVGPTCETIIDFSIYDAIRAGFGKIIFVIRRDIEEQIKKSFIIPLAHRIKIDYVFQDLDDLPDGIELSKDRMKPWGTSHAILVARKKINEPFGVINSDDYYGVE